MKGKNIFGKITYGLLFVSFMACGQANSNSTEVAQQSEPEPFTQEGKASYYARSLKGSTMANGKPYQPTRMTAAHRRLPLGTKVEVVNPDNDNSVVVEITDRGPFVKNRIIDLSRAAAEELDFVQEGITDVAIQVIEPAEGYTVGDSTINRAANN